MGNRVFLAWRHGLRQYPVLSGAVILFFIILAIFADFIITHSPYQSSLPDRLLPPFWQDGGSTRHLLGTDALGRDILSRIVMGARISLAVAFTSLVIGGVIGSSAGICAGYFGGWVDVLVMRTTDAVLSFPILLLALLLAITRGANFENLIISMCIALWSRYARVVRGEVMSLRERDFVALAKVAGRSPWWIMFHHIFPNTINTIVVLVTLQVGWLILVEAILSFLGAGVPPPYPAWGTMVSDGRDYLATAWWISAFPGLAILLIALSFNLFGDWLREALDPKMRETMRGIQ